MCVAVDTGPGISIRNWKNATSLTLTTDWRLALTGRTGANTLTSRFKFTRVEAVAYNITPIASQNPLKVSLTATGARVYNYTRTDFKGDDWADLGKWGAFVM
jgi:hypothetical protein